MYLTNTYERRAGELANILLEKGSPTTGNEAAEFWDLLSSHHKVDTKRAKILYNCAGYVEFEGYPLKRKQNRI